MIARRPIAILNICVAVNPCIVIDRCMLRNPSVSYLRKVFFFFNPATEVTSPYVGIRNVSKSFDPMRNMARYSYGIKIAP